MSAVDSPHNTTTFDRSTLPSKRKLDDYDSSESNGAGSDELSSTPTFYTRHRKSPTLPNSKGKSVIEHDPNPFHSSTPRYVGESSGGNSNSNSNSAFTISDKLQFFVKAITGGKTLVIRAKLTDTVRKIHEDIQGITGIPLMEQRLIYRGKQLQWEDTLEQCGVTNDAGMQLVGRMRSTARPRSWRVVSDMVNVICKLCRKESTCFDCRVVKVKLEQYMALPLDEGVLSEEEQLLVSDDVDRTRKGFDEEFFRRRKVMRSEYYMIFMEACAPQALVMMYMSSEARSRECADDCIRCFVSFLKDLEVERSERAYCVTIVLVFCRLLRMGVCEDNLLYLHCRSTLGLMLDKVDVGIRSEGEERRSGAGVGVGEVSSVAVQDIFPFLQEVGQRLVRDMGESLKSNGGGTGPLLMGVCDFSAFLQPVLSFTWGKLAAAASRKDKRKGKEKLGSLGDEVSGLFHLFSDLLSGIDKCLGKMEMCLSMKWKKENDVQRSGWPHYLSILKELSSISLLFPGYEDRFWTVMRQNKVAVRSLVVQYATRAEDHCWLFEQKDVLDFESRRHLAMLMFPEVREDYEELHEMLIDRSQLLAESFEYISSAQPSSLHAGLFMEFKNEEATGPGVLREWFCLVCQAIFDPKNALFIACPLDHQRFYPGPASKVDPLHLRYFRFSGRVIALALMHKIQVGIVLDRVFFLQLAGRLVTLEDIQDTDPCIYNSCKKILEMDPEFVDSDGLGLTFVTEVEELGARKVVELCPGGEDIVVNSKNRKDYVNLIVQHHFVVSISEQISSFAQGFADILRDGYLRATFFESLELEDLDWILRGSGNEISVEDWKAHTEYHGYKKSDPQILWFWEVVGQLNAEQKKTLLFFWTSVKYLPVEGFRGLASRVYIYKSLEPQDRLPSSHTCFYRLCIPPYPSKAVVRDRLLVITQEHVGCSFGTW